jgi:hypothetical protein
MKSVLSLIALAASALPAAACPYGAVSYGYSYAQSYSYAPAAAVVTYNLVTPYAPVLAVPAQVQCPSCSGVPAQQVPVPAQLPAKQVEVQPMAYRQAAVREQIVVASYRPAVAVQAQVYAQRQVVVAAQPAYGYASAGVAVAVARPRAVVVASPVAAAVVVERRGLFQRLADRRAGIVAARAGLIQAAPRAVIVR